MGTPAEYLRLAQKFARFVAVGKILPAEYAENLVGQSAVYSPADENVAAAVVESVPPSCLELLKALAADFSARDSYIGGPDLTKTYTERIRGWAAALNSALSREST